MIHHLSSADEVQKAGGKLFDSVIDAVNAGVDLLPPYTEKGVDCTEG